MCEGLAEVGGREMEAARTRKRSREELDTMSVDFNFTVSREGERGGGG